MTWKNFSGGSWETPTPKRLEDGQWVPITGGDDGGGGGGGGGGDIPSRFHTDGPPERSGETITYDGSNYASLQDAYDGLTEGDTLVLEPGTYEERLRLAENRVDHVTIDGTDATLRRPDTDEVYALGMSRSEVGHTPDHPDQASIAGAHTDGESVLSVDDASPFEGEEGSVIHVTEDRNPYGTTAHFDDYTHEYRVIESVDTASDELELANGLQLPYPDENETWVGVCDWFVDDVRLTGLTVEGNRGLGDDPWPVLLYGYRRLWVDGLTLENSGYKPLMGLGFAHRCRFDGITCRDGEHYGINVIHGATDTLLTDVEYLEPAGDANRYTVRFGRAGGSGRGAVGGLARDVRGHGLSRTTANVHLGGYNVRWEDVLADDNQVSTLRSHHLTVDGFAQDGGTGRSFVCAQVPDECVVKNGTITNKDSSVVFYFGAGIDSRDYDWQGDVTFENIEIDAYDGRGPEDIGDFTSDGADIRGTLTFRDVFYGGQRLQREHVEQWSNYDDAEIANLFVE